MHRSPPPGVEERPHCSRLFSGETTRFIFSGTHEPVTYPFTLTRAGYMAETNQKVMDMVRDQLQKNPDIATSELYEKAQKLDSSVKQLTLRQFHARYPLQVKRQIAVKSGRRRTTRRRRRRGKELDRGAIRNTLLSFAREVSSADNPADMIDAVTSVEKYVDQIAKVVDGGKR